MLGAILYLYEELKQTYGAVLAPYVECRSYIDKGEHLLCAFSFPDERLRIKAIGRDDVTVSMFPDLKLLFIFEHDTQEVFSRVCNGEARGIPWETISHYCDVLEDAINDYL